MQFLTDAFSAMAERIRSPIIGSIAIAFVAFNWKPIFFLAFSSTPILLKFSYFDLMTSLNSLFVYPIIIGTVVALISPFVSLFGFFCASWPITKLRLRQTKLAHDVLEEKAKFTIAREQAGVDLKRVLLSRAEADQAIKDAPLDKDVRDELEDRVEKSQKTIVDLTNINSSLRGPRGGELMDLLRLIAEGNDGTIIRFQNLVGTSFKVGNQIIPHNASRRAIIRLEVDLRELEALGLIRDRGSKRELFELTDDAYKLLEHSPD